MRLGDRRRFYFSLRSPYSWLAYLDLTAHHPRLCERLTWIPFWEPDEPTLGLLAEAGGEFTYAQMSRPKHLYVLQDMQRQAAARGLALRWPVDRAPRWEVPHAAYLVAAGRGHGRRFLELAHRARWEQGQDICDPATVALIATQLGLAAGDLAGAADRDEVRAEGVRALLSAYRDGVFGVPFFINGYAKYWGVERLGEFVASFAGAPPAPAPPQPALAGGGFSAEGHAGGCG
jgi:2-hydroxychromene-2-carboxylate isomerase